MTDTVHLRVTLGSWYLRHFRPVVLRVLGSFAPEGAPRPRRYTHPEHRDTTSVATGPVLRVHAAAARAAVRRELEAALHPRHHGALSRLTVEVEEPLPVTRTPQEGP